MNNELAKQLKDAGFPLPEEHMTGHYDSWILQKTYGLALGIDSKSEVHEIRLFPGMTYARNLVYVPTLSELIEACGDDFRWLDRFSLNGEVMFRASSGGLHDHVTQGRTPEEAVAQLWLKINRKQ